MSIDDIKKKIEEEAVEAERVFRLAIEQALPFNQNLRLTHGPKRKDTYALFEFIESIPHADGAENARHWYANGPVCEDRPGVLAVFHPAIHKKDGEWDKIYKTAQAIAKDLKRWIWLTVGEDRWARISLGPDPRRDPDDVEDDEDTTGPQYNAKGEYQNDQFITTMGPDGEEHFVGCS